MNNLLYIIAAVLVLFWTTGYFYYNAGSSIHALLVIAVLFILVQVIKEQNSIN
ncbi:lmo0937 family membrane protein [Flavobacterium sandaracinum]|uniref:Lmo0937 family membrane protein n=1 Tax=Flavobacterium sandaracinum TaxID=2541733 RepID=A0A4R5CQT6_9FLAO|nr:lmo0937 family membrane protein [Flavobacterium sandaracinum]TDE01700.1 lmo0937 family membrane protein [Flavobacterium sandaracinum]